MTSELFAHVDGAGVERATVYVPPRGPWWADVDMLQASPLSGRVTLSLGSLSLVGTVLERYAGTLGEQRHVRIVGGAGGWERHLPPKGYHSDSGVQSRTVVADLAREAGETLSASVAPTAASLGVDYARPAAVASRTLEDVIGDALWWVEYDGTTSIGSRSLSQAEAGSYQMIGFDPRSRMAELTMDELGAVVVGMELREGFDAPVRVASLEIHVEESGTHVRAWCPTEPARRSRPADALESIVERVVSRRRYGKIRYRVARMAGDRVELQIVRSASGLPDLIPVSMWPGVAGVHATLALGAEVLVEFIEGDVSQPIITGFVGRGGAGFAPTQIDIGDAPTSPIALAPKVDAVLDMLFDLLSGTQVLDPTTGLPIVGGLWSPTGTLADAGLLKTAAIAIKPAVISSASSLVRSK